MEAVGQGGGALQGDNTQGWTGEWEAESRGRESGSPGYSMSPHERGFQRLTMYGHRPYASPGTSNPTPIICPTETHYVFPTKDTD